MLTLSHYSILTLSTPAGGIFLLSDPDLNGALNPQYILTVNITDGEFYDAKTIIVDIVIVNTPAVFVNLPTQVRKRTA